MPRRNGIKHGGVSGGMRPNSHKTNIIPGANPRGDGRVSCGHKPTQPERYVTKDDYILPRRVCEDCFQRMTALPDSEWRAVALDEAPPVETALERENRLLRIALNVAMSRLRSRPDWPLIQKLAGLALDVEAIFDGKPVDMDAIGTRIMDSEVAHFLTAMDRGNLLPDGKPNRIVVGPSNVTVAGLLNAREPGIETIATVRSIRERDATLAAIARGEQ